MRLSSNEAVIVAPLGPNPAPLVELIWALHRQRELTAVSAHVIVDARGAVYLEGELLAKDGPLDELGALLGPTLVDASRIHIRLVCLPSGAPLEDDEDPTHAELYNAAVWETARDAIASAGERPVVFGLAAGRRRTMTAMATAAFQLLARPMDLCLDVRVDERRAEGGSGFFFPEQREQRIDTPQGSFLAREVGIALVDVRLPRLRGLLHEKDLESYAGALAAGQAAVDAAHRLPELVVDLTEGHVLVDGSPLRLSPAQVLWYATLAVARRRGDGRVAADDFELLRDIAIACAPRAWMEKMKSEPIRTLMAYKAYTAAELTKDLKKLKTDTRSRVRAWCGKHAKPYEERLVPALDAEGDGQLGLIRTQRLDLDPIAIEVRGFDGT